ncbi:unknown [Candidatus Colimorpha enterica]|uniref:Uncharacterized protein n=1 Tax=Candidatus Colimorpha enterica TaxID=3083063 RepID=R6TTZ3_9BACT|nr:unknown [Candidatus Colimorpha enterica]
MISPRQTTSPVVRFISRSFPKPFSFCASALPFSAATEIRSQNLSVSTGLSISTMPDGSRPMHSFARTVTVTPARLNCSVAFAASSAPTVP